jgi:thiamine-phosphate pyrophosphorylase
MVQLREKTLDDDAFLERARALRPLCEAHGALLVLNDRVHLVEDAGADGVHVGEDDVPPEVARDRLGPDLLVGLSTHDEAEIQAVGMRGADHAGLGPCFATSTKTLARAPGGKDLVARCLPHAAGLPVFPVGGVTSANVSELVDAGASRVAVGAGVLEAPNPADAVRRIHAALLAEGGSAC